jgi:hypothetical protein
MVRYGFGLVTSEIARESISWSNCFGRLTFGYYG